MPWGALSLFVGLDTRWTRVRVAFMSVNHDEQAKDYRPRPRVLWIGCDHLGLGFVNSEPSCTGVAGSPRLSRPHRTAAVRRPSCAGGLHPARCRRRGRPIGRRLVGGVGRSDGDGTGRCWGAVCRQTEWAQHDHGHRGVTADRSVGAQGALDRCAGCVRHRRSGRYGRGRSRTWSGSRPPTPSAPTSCSVRTISPARMSTARRTPRSPPAISPYR
jgi:hypothetical protein